MSSNLSRRNLLRYGTGAVAATGLALTANISLAGTASAYGWSRNLSEGMSGADVKELQIRVAGWAYDTPKQTYVAVDGEFGPGTKGALLRFQKAYGLSQDGVAGPQTFAALNALESSDGSTAHFDWTEFHSKDGSGFSGGKVPATVVKENVRRNMYKLEALRKKAGDRPVTVTSGFRSIAHNSQQPGSGTNSMHLYGVAADIQISGLTTYQIYRIAETCGYSGLERYTNSWQHVDSRIEYPYGSQSWWWESGIV